MSTQPAWLRGPVDGVPPLLQPVAHAFIDAEEDLQRVLPSLTAAQAWARPAGAASIAYHLRHAIGSLDRLFTYARGETLSDDQQSALAREKRIEEESPVAGTALLAEFSAALEVAREQLRVTRAEELLATRYVGRARLPSTTIGLLVHAAEHTARHVGQAVTTAKIVAG